MMIRPITANKPFDYNFDEKGLNQPMVIEEVTAEKSQQNNTVCLQSQTQKTSVI